MAATLVTGAAGFIALNVIEQLLGEGETVVAHDLRPLPGAACERWRSLPGELRATVGDVRDGATIAAAFELAPIDRVIHTAAVTLGPRPGDAVVERAFDVNVAGTATVLDAAVAHSVTRFVHVSSGAVYGGAAFGDAPVDESCPAQPTTAYGYSKLAAERLARRANDTTALQVVRARLTAAFGPWEHPSGVRQTLSPLLQIAHAAVSGASVVLAAGGARDWTSADDLARGLIRLARAPRLVHDVYNLGLGEVWHPELLCRALAQRCPSLRWSVGSSTETTVDYNDRLDLRRMPIDAGRARAELALAFAQPEAASVRYAAWAADRPDWFAA